MPFKHVKVVWKGQKATRHFTRDTLEDANFHQVEVPPGAIEWGLYNEDTTVRLDVSYQYELEAVRAVFNFFTLDLAGSPRSWIREESRPAALYVRRNVAHHAYYFEAITLGWDEEAEPVEEGEDNG